LAGIVPREKLGRAPATAISACRTASDLTADAVAGAQTTTRGAGGTGGGGGSVELIGLGGTNGNSGANGPAG